MITNMASAPQARASGLGGSLLFDANRPLGAGTGAFRAAFAIGEPALGAVPTGAAVLFPTRPAGHQLALVKKKQAEREAIQKDIADLGKQRDEYIRDFNKKNANAGDKAFDEAVRGALRDQAKQKGITIPD